MGSSLLTTPTGVPALDGWRLRVISSPGLIISRLHLTGPVDDITGFVCYVEIKLAMGIRQTKIGHDTSHGDDSSLVVGDVGSMLGDCRATNC